MNKPVSGDAYRRTGAYFEELRVTASKVPNMTVVINEGSYFGDNRAFVEFEGAVSPTILAPSTGYKWVVVGVNNVGTAFVASGEPAMKDPKLPDLERNQLPLAAIYVGSTTTQITSDMIYDVRPFINGGFYHDSHSFLLNTDAVNCHPIKSITGLTEVLDGKASLADLDRLDRKIDLVPGTNATTFVINQAQTGAPSVNAGISVCRGNEPAVGIRFNDRDGSGGTWEFTNDGTTWYKMVTSLNVDGSLKQATDLTAGVTRLSVPAVNALIPIAVADNDPRIQAVALKANAADVYTKTEVDGLLADYAAVADTYNKQTIDEMIHGKMDVGTIYTIHEIDHKLLGKVNVGDAYTKPESDLLLNDKANSADVYTKTEVDASLALKADTVDVYTKTEADALLDVKANLADVYVKAEVNDALDLKANTADTYTKAEVDTALADKANLVDVYGKTEANVLLGDKANAADVYVKSEVDDAVNAKANANDVYTKAEADALLGVKADAGLVYTKAEADAFLNAKANAADVYNKVTVDTLLSAKPDATDTYTKADVNALFTPYAKKDEVTLKLAEYTKTTSLYTRSEVDSLLAAKSDTASLSSLLTLKADVTSVYTKTEVDNKLSLKADVTALNAGLTAKANVADVYSKADMDAKLDDKGNKAELVALLADKADNSDLLAYYTKAEVTNILNDYAKLVDVVSPSVVYTKSEVNSTFALKTDVAAALTDKANATDVSAALALKVDASALATTNGNVAALQDTVVLKANATDVYTKSEVDAKFSGFTASSVVLTSPDSSKYSITVDNSGNITATKLP